METPNYLNIFPGIMKQRDSYQEDWIRTSSTYDEKRQNEELRIESNLAVFCASHHAQKTFLEYYTHRPTVDPIESFEITQRHLQKDKARKWYLSTLRFVTSALEHPSTEFENFRKETDKADLEKLCVFEKSAYECLNRTHIDQLEKLRENFIVLIKNTFIPFESSARLDIKVIKEIIDDHIKSSIKEGNLKKARATLKSAEGLFPGDKNYKKFLEIIAPPKLISTKKAATEGISETISFLKKKGNEFKNKWIAVRHGQLLGVSDSYAELFEKHKTEDIFITRII